MRVPAANLSRVSPQDACAICGRTFLVGEQVHSYVSIEGRHEVCHLCADRTAELGWLPADQEGAEERLRAEAERKPGFLSRLFAREEHEGPEMGDEREEPAEHEEEAERLVRDEAPRTQEGPVLEIHELETERYDVEAEWRDEDQDAEASPAPMRGRLARRGEEDVEDAEPSPVRRRLSGLFGPARRREAEPATHGATAGLPAPEASERDLPADAPHGHAAHLPSPDRVPAPEHSTPPPAAPAPPADASPAPLPDPAGRGMRPRRLQPDLSPASRFERAIARFNSSDAGRTAAGLTRTLGAPSVSVGDLAGEEDVVRITVAWELTWYQWGVDLEDELRPVFDIDKGYEVSEIDAAARQWNASAHDGRIVMVAPRRQEAENGRPVHR
jgi:hypothetical protein